MAIHDVFIQRWQLIQLGVPSSLIALCLDEGPGNPICFPYVDYTKLYAVVRILVRCYDLSVKQQSSLEVSYSQLRIIKSMVCV